MPVVMTVARPLLQHGIRAQPGFGPGHVGVPHVLSRRALGRTATNARRTSSVASGDAGSATTT